MPSAHQDKFLIACVILTTLVFLLFARATLSAKKFKKDFREEMAQRLDLEEKLLRLENREKTSGQEIEALKKEGAEYQQELVAAKQQLLIEEREKALLKNTLLDTQRQLKHLAELASAATPMPSAASKMAAQTDVAEAQTHIRAANFSPKER